MPVPVSAAAAEVESFKRKTNPETEGVSNSDHGSPSSNNDASIFDVSLLRGVKEINIDNMAHFIQECIRRNGDRAHKHIDNVIAELSELEMDVLVKQARNHPQVRAFLLDTLGDEMTEDDVLQFCENDPMAEVVTFVEFLAEKDQQRQQTCDQPAQPPTSSPPSSISGDGADVDFKDYEPDFPKKHGPWYYMRSFAQVSCLLNSE